MIITLNGANFANNNINDLLNTFSVSYSGTGVTGTPRSIQKENGVATESLSATITIASNYTYESLTVRVGGNLLTAGTDYTVSGTGPVTLSIDAAKITGNVVVSVQTSSTGGDVVDPDEPGNDLGATDITNLFTFNLTTAAYPSNGVAKSSVYLDSCSPVDISSYSGTHLYISHANFTPTAGGSSGYGAVFFDASGNMLKFEEFPSYTSSGPKGAYRDSFLEIPSGAKTFATSIFNSAAISNSVYEGTTSDFHCSIVNLSTETDITSMFDFNTSGYAWRVSNGDGNVTSYQTQYWNSDTVDMSAYAGKAIKIAVPVARTTQNTQVPYGYAYEDVSGNNYVLHHFALLDDGGTLLAGNVTDLTIMLPSDIKNLLVCYFSDAMYNAANPITEEVRNGFYCKLLG